jgi:hypothetical protein
MFHSLLDFLKSKIRQGISRIFNSAHKIILTLNHMQGKHKNQIARLYLKTMYRYLSISGGSCPKYWSERQVLIKIL